MNKSALHKFITVTIKLPSLACPYSQVYTLIDMDFSCNIVSELEISRQCMYRSNIQLKKIKMI